MKTAGLRTHRVMGIETEFGVLHSDAQARSRVGTGGSILLSHLAVNAYALLAPAEGERGRRVRWDYGDETPLRDARGFELERAAAHPSQLTDSVRDAHVPSVDLDLPLQAPELPPAGEDVDDTMILDWATRRSIGNAVLRNGARLYVDHAHPEYSSPEVTSARQGVQWDRAGEVIAQEAMEIIAGADTIPDITLYKNNTDGKGAAYGTHENFLVDRDVPFDRVVSALVPFLVSRPIVTGAGRVGLGTHGQRPGFQLSSRADFFEAVVGLETTLNRPIVNSRDEPHADARRHRRLHLIMGDANLLETPTYLKLGTTSLVLAALEREQETGERILPRLELADPVEAVAAISHDLTLRARIPLADGGTTSALELQRAHHAALLAHADLEDAETADVLTQWGEILDQLEQDPMLAADRVEWAAKLRLLQGYRDRHGLDWDDARLQLIDLQFTDLRPGRGLALKLRAQGSVRTVVSEDEVRRAVLDPPPETRAHLRGRLVARHRADVVSAGWDVLTLARPDGSATRIRTPDPEVGSQPWCSRHGVDPDADPDQVLAALAAALDPTTPTPSPTSSPTSRRTR